MLVRRTKNLNTIDDLVLGIVDGSYLLWPVDTPILPEDFPRCSFWPLSAQPEDVTIVDPRPSGFWVDTGRGMIFPEYCERCFLENLDNDAPRELAIFSHYVSCVASEYPAPSEYRQFAVQLYENFCKCPSCDYCFEVRSDFGQLRCPNCRIALNNPCADHSRLIASQANAFRDPLPSAACRWYNPQTGKYERMPLKTEVMSSDRLFLTLCYLFFFERQCAWARESDSEWLLACEYYQHTCRSSNRKLMEQFEGFSPNRCRGNLLRVPSYLDRASRILSEELFRNPIAEGLFLRHKTVRITPDVLWRLYEVFRRIDELFSHPDCRPGYHRLTRIMRYLYFCKERLANHMKLNARPIYHIQNFGYSSPPSQTLDATLTRFFHKDEREILQSPWFS